VVPAAIMGLDVVKLLGAAEEMAHACSASVPVDENPGAVLGIIMGVAARKGRDKVTLVASPGIAGVGVWVEQLLTASLGKGGGGLLAVDGEPVGPPAVYGTDRLFVYLRLETAADAAQDAAVAALEAAGTPWFVSPSPSRTVSAPSSSAGSSPLPWPGPCSASIPLTSPTSRAARWPRAS
jgi:hypothetical protein